MAARFTYGKKEKLKSRKEMEALFASGASLRHYPLRIYYLTSTADRKTSIPRTGVGAPSRQFKKAVERNRIKRQLREAYRLHKQPLLDFCEKNQKAVILFILYTGKELPESPLVHQKLSQAIQKLVTNLYEATDANS